MRLRYKPWARELIANHRDLALNEDDLDSLPSFEYLELGCGCGEFLIKKAQANPNKNYLGVEINYIAFAIAVKKLVSEEVIPHNIHFINADANKLFAKIKPGSLQAVYLNFNDPWPKKKHHKRRLTYPSRLQLYFDLLKVGGKVIYKSDNDVYFNDSCRYFKEFNKFHLIINENYVKLDEGDVMSEYEQKFRKLNQPIHQIIGIKEQDN
ncbi:MAG: tRNA (guanosine(46)-N7)-methyltransferase TrmB [Bacilli bacterium]|nr:tRNA (guanosine(46)-N7)-methyltransferase TrmB [Bacilli bacterium]